MGDEVTSLRGRPTSAAFTADGTLWVGTRSGLLRRTGARWTLFDVHNSELPQSKISELHGGAKLAIVSRAGFATSLDPSTGAASRWRTLLPHAPTRWSERPVVAGDELLAVAGAPGHGLWLGRPGEPLVPFWSPIARSVTGIACAPDKTCWVVGRDEPPRRVTIDWPAGELRLVGGAPEVVAAAIDVAYDAQTRFVYSRSSEGVFAVPAEARRRHLRGSPSLRRVSSIRRRATCTSRLTIRSSGSAATR